MRWSVLLASVVWLELLINLSLTRFKNLPYYSQISAEDLYGLRCVTFGWPVGYALMLAMIYVMGLYAEGASEGNPQPRKLIDPRKAADFTLNPAIVVVPLLLGAFIAIDAVRILLG
jgi:hypothetical protein